MYKIFVILVMLLSLCGADVLSRPATRANVIQDRGWHAGTFRGLTIGKSTRADMLRVFGNPVYSGPSADQNEPQPIIWNDYGMITGELSGRVAIEVDSRSNIIVGITITPEGMSKDVAIAHFGNNFRLVGYKSCPDSGVNDETWPVYESPNSSEINYIEYREKGIAIHLSNQGSVNAIYFLSEPIGLASKADCKKELEKLAREPRPR